MTHIYIINLKDRPDRLQSTLCELHKVQFPKHKVHVVQAIDTRDLTYQDALVRFPEIDARNLHAIRDGQRSEHYELTSGSIGCFYSHIKAWAEIVSSTHTESCIIVEDDIYFPNIFRARDMLQNKKMLEKKLQMTDLFLLGHTGFHKTHPILAKQYKHQYPEDLNVQWFMGLQCYALTKKTANLLLSTIGAPCKQIDWQICDLVQEKKIRARAAVIRYVKVFDKDSDIQISQPCYKSWK